MAGLVCVIRLVCGPTSSAGVSIAFNVINYILNILCDILTASVRLIVSLVPCLTITRAMTRAVRPRPLSVLDIYKDISIYTYVDKYIHRHICMHGPSPPLECPWTPCPACLSEMKGLQQSSASRPKRLCCLTSVGGRGR